MLVNSRQILTEINNTAHLKEALALVVQRSRSSMDATACSAFVIDDTQSDQYLLMAADGSAPGAVGKTRVSRNEGLVGWVAVHEEAVNINIANAADHPGEVLSLFDAYTMMLDSDRLDAGTVARISNGQWTRGALRDTIC